LAVAAKLAEELGVGWRSESLKVASGPNLQARAREARHAALARAAREEGAIAIALGHTADDRAETVVLRILRGAGARGLAVLPLDGPPFLSEGLPLFRPLIAARRAEVVAHLARHRLEAAEDPSNRDRRFARARVRHEVMPLLEELSPRVVDHLCAIAEDLAAPEPREEPSFLADLGRKQREALLRAIDQRRGGTTVRVSGGRDLEVRFLRGTPVVFVPK
ncbi:MAG: tRNA lysidine(34) synthetase TilS, partial [Myxococcales bacterium]|nr:tRNA lysidine(34) synthetase TilS [Myxococcales bacterium]